MKTTYKKLFELILVTLFFLGLVTVNTGCTPEELTANVRLLGRFYTDGITTVGYGTFPDGRSVITVMTQANGQVLEGTYQASAEELAKTAADLSQRGFEPIGFTYLPGMIQLRVMANVENIMSSQAVLPAFLPVFLTTPIFNLPGVQGCSFGPDGWDCSQKS